MGKGRENTGANFGSNGGGTETLFQKLVTKEDSLSMHKILGVAVLGSMMVRLALFFQGDADMGFVNYPEYTVPTVLLHLMLNLSSFVFKIPPKRIASGYRIWPEYRLHSLVFACRSLSYILLYWYEIVYRNGKRLFLADTILAMGTLVAADMATRSVSAKHRSGFSRELQVAPLVKVGDDACYICGYRAIRGDEA